MALRGAQFVISGLIAGIVILILYCFYITTQYGNAIAQLEREQLQNESLLSDKLSVEKNLFKTTRSLNVLKMSQADLSSRLARKGARLREEVKLSENLERKIDTLHQRLNQFVTERSLSKKKLSLLRLSNSDLFSKQMKLHDSLLNMAALMNRLRVENQINQTFIDKTRVTATRGVNKRLTIRARRTKQLRVSINVAQNLKELHFTLTGPDGFLDNEKSGRLSYSLMDNAGIRTASLVKFVDSFNSDMTIEVKYVPMQKLKPGIYELRVFNDDGYVGSTSIKLK
jgi:hypothetical protein